ncbi:hypothetical protein METBIDRAFT_68809 [Metschnikowia bicuspidata var. bicuspidata NRRL YB-4993]|uniref:Rpr2-domain-containing protein n=1 Tax=Metschnikowia bicuspidata var. bicuspidata NRRL YB-4993 TaxID=869754 RepID=A0A1A0HAJ5_9ASCO|nr:hypothetical protein METBIDRAFT_68809 [Metschnikowia bicuspidata var. bicuspidata NRRL YB-4993]OBA20897.1 hypothetical protein METBIDRAFT_68809 [Metschnikowia bicuspidata var. bicuspidata NRRL YB-4993]
MAKQQRTPKVQKDHYARTSFLFQAANFYASHGNPVMSRMMLRSVDLVAKRTVLRVLPHVKRQMCKTCSSILIPGLTMKTEVENLLKNPSKSRKADVLVHTCLECDTTKRFPIGKDPSYVLHCDRNAFTEK